MRSGEWGRSERRRARPTQPVGPTLRRIAGLLGPYRLTLAGYFVTVVIASLAGLGPPLLIREIIDRALPQQDESLLNLLVVFIVALVLLTAVNSTLQSYLSNITAHNVVFDLRTRIYRRLTRMSLRWFTANRTGDALSRVSNDVGGIQGIIADTLGSVAGNIITVVSTLAVMAAIDWRLALFSIIFVPVFLIPAQRIGNIQRHLVSETQEQLAGLNNQMQETLSVSGALLVKTFGREEQEMGTFQDTARTIRDLSMRRAIIGRWFNTALTLFGSIAPAVVYWYGGHQIIGEQASLGTVVAQATLLARLYSPITNLLNVHVSVLSSIALFERIFAYMDLDQDIMDAPDARPLGPVLGNVRFQNVSFSYLQDGHTLEDVTFEVPAGRFAALVGPTGAGKTTIAYLIPRLYDVTSGQVLIDGEDVRDVTLTSLSAAIGMVNQEPFLFHASVRQNLQYARPDVTDDEIEAAARAANIHNFIASLPEGYETIVGERGYRLSGGEKQRLAIARAILKDPAILILDEATSSVDSATERSIQEAIEQLSRGRTVIAIAHRLSTILSADIILVIDNGRLVDSGRHDELLARGGLYAQLYAQQFRVFEPVGEV